VSCLETTYHPAIRAEGSLMLSEYRHDTRMTNSILYRYVVSQKCNKETILPLLG